VESDQGRLKELADEQGTSVAALQTLLLALQSQTGAAHFYIFWLTGSAAATPRAQRQRTLLAFRTPDAALAFAQRNQLIAAAQPRLRRLSILQLVQAVLREQAISALLFVADEQADAALPTGALPPGIRIERAHLLAQLASTPHSIL
jgi:hypothetical protein